MSMPRVLITGDYPLVRTALNALLSTVRGIAVVGECANDAGAIGAAVGALQPNIVVMDCDLDGSTSRQVLAELLRGAKHCAVLILTAEENRRAITCALQHGVLGVVSKERSADVLMRAIHTVASGETWLERSIVVNIVREEKNDVECRTQVVYEKLTPRQSEIVDLVSQGLPNKKIAERLFISETTVRHHLTTIYGKLDVANRLQLMRYAYQDGMAVA